MLKVIDDYDEILDDLNSVQTKEALMMVNANWKGLKDAIKQLVANATVGCECLASAILSAT